MKPHMFPNSSTVYNWDPLRIVAPHDFLLYIPEYQINVCVWVCMCMNNQNPSLYKEKLNLFLFLSVSSLPLFFGFLPNKPLKHIKSSFVLFNFVTRVCMCCVYFLSCVCECVSFKKKQWQHSLEEPHPPTSWSLWICSLHYSIILQ